MIVDIPFGAWQPDSANIDSPYLTDAKNVYASENGYFPIPQLQTYGASSLPTACVGMAFARTENGGWQAFAGTRTKLYRLIGSTWTDYSRVSGGAYAVPTDEYWSFAQFGSYLIAVNAADDAQVIDVDSGASAFSALGGSPPKARYVGVVGQFVFLAALSTNIRKVRNSGVGSATSWTVGTDLCSEQEFTDGGRVTGFAGGEFGFVAQEKAIRQAILQPGSDVAFRFERLEQERGCIAGYGLVSAARFIFYPSDDGFYAFNGQALLPIGASKINRWFRANSDSSRNFSIIGFSDPYGPRIYWAFYSTAASTTFDRLLIYDWKLDRWSYAAQAAQFWGAISTPGYTLEDLDAFGTMETLPYPLDSRAWEGGSPAIAAFNTSGAFAFLEGTYPMDAVLVTSEMHLGGAERVKISGGAYPVGIWNSAALSLTPLRREHTGVSQTTGAAITPSTSSGWARFIQGGRVHQFQLNVSQSSGDVLWSHAQGLKVEFERDDRK